MQQQNQQPSAVLVLPVYTADPLFLASLGNQCLELLNRTPAIHWTIIVVNDGSASSPSAADFFRRLPRSINCHYYHYKGNRGKGHAVRYGLSKAADADLYIYTDYDFPFGTQAVAETACILLQQRTDVVTADRGKRYIRMLPGPRKIITRLSRFVNSRLLHLQVTDVQAGLKGMNHRGLAVMLHTNVNGFLFDLQFIKAASDQRLRIHTLPVFCADHIELQNFRPAVIFRELKNLWTILTHKHENQHTLPVYRGPGGIRLTTGIRSYTAVGNTGSHQPAGAGAPAVAVAEPGH